MERYESDAERESETDTDRRMGLFVRRYNMGGYKKSTSQMVRVWMSRKKLTGDNERGSRGARMQTLRRFDERSTRMGVGGLAKNNSAMREMIAKTNEEVIFLKGGVKIYDRI